MLTCRGTARGPRNHCQYWCRSGAKFCEIADIQYRTGTFRLRSDRGILRTCLPAGARHEAVVSLSLLDPDCYRGSTKGWFSKRVVLADVPRNETGTRVHSDAPPERKAERGYLRMFPRNENRNEGTFLAWPCLQILGVKKYLILCGNSR